MPNPWIIPKLYGKNVCACLSRLEISATIIHKHNLYIFMGTKSNVYRTFYIIYATLEDAGIITVYDKFMII